MKHTLISSPLQSFTDYRFRNPFNTVFGEIDVFYAPYIRLNGKLEIKTVYENDLLKKNNPNITVIPQVMTNSAEEFLFVSNYVKKLGYDELNWNLGCPYPMVINKGLGSGLICQPHKIEEILHKVHNESDIIVSMKMRMGYESSDEILKTLPILEKYPIKNIGVHARIGKQLYNGGVDLDAFAKCIENTSHTLYYNGDITSLSFFKELSSRFPRINHWMIGRGMIANPFLPSIIKNHQDDRLPSNYKKKFKQFHDLLFDEFHSTLDNDRQTIMKLHHYWEYFNEIFNVNKEIKKIKKCKSIEDYHEIVKDILS